MSDEQTPTGGEQQEQQQVDPFIDKAKAAGWRPLEEFEGDPEQWVDAKEFVKRAPLYEKNHKLSKKVTDLERTINDLKGHIGKVSEAAYQRAYNDLMTKRDEAIEVGDKDTVREIDKAIKETEALKPDNTPIIDPALKEWEAENGKWFYGDPEISTFGHAWCANFMRNNPNVTSWEDVLPGMEKAVKKAFPEKFENQKRKDPPPVEGGGSQGAKKGFTRNDLNEEQRKVCDNFVRKGIMSADEYIKGLEEAGELGGKK